MVSTRSRSTVKPPQNPLASTCRRRHTTVSSRGSATRGQGSGRSRRGGGATNQAAHTSQHNPSPTPTDDAAQEHNNNSPTRNDERDESAHNQYNDNGDTEEFVDNGENDESEEMEPEDIGLTLANFESRLKIQEILNYQKAKYTKIKLMLALIGRVSEKTVNAFLIASAETPGWKERNKKLGASWQLLTADQKNVFDARVFAFFSKLPINLENHTTNINGNSNCDDDDDEPLDEPLTTEEKEFYKPLYEDLVNHKKVELVLAQGPTQDSAIPPQALQQVTRLNEKLFTVANSYNLTFYSLAATRSPGAGSFWKEFSNDASWLNVTKNEWNAKQTFEAYSHGRAIQEIVEEISPDGKPPAKKAKKANCIRRTLRIELNQLLAQALGRTKAKFPMQKDPSTTLTKTHPTLRIHQTKSSTLRSEDLVVGLEKMLDYYRQKWLADIRNGDFQIVHIDRDLS
ncbi:hypothetical protein PCANC_17591 [Puccinia coronata f. sp. avenae]|uniref:Uncharacterized protein n=1 Tax=Puccinia coronata f. sp. avenae TaxID=200324 RepID=A0A2N5VN11_9BASI|nr:hypothetical protein PCASD_22015 [Puccinia coronata f. sp. avenae]PLW51357.1 hypothetical protein PCANC_17591 [Puccinia coronata f. sp. avenae]